MKKIWVLLLVTMMTLCTACSDDGVIRIKETKEVETALNDALSAFDDISVPNLDVESIPDLGKEEFVSDKNSVQTNGTNNLAISAGYMQANDYINEYLGMGCHLGEAWDVTICDEDELSGDYIMVMEAMNSDEVIGMNIAYQKLSKQEKAGFELAGEDGMIDMTLQLKEEMTESYEAEGIELVEMSSQEVPFAGENRIAIQTKAKINELDYYVLQFILYEHGDDYVTFITCYSFIEDIAQDVANLFYNL